MMVLQGDVPARVAAPFGGGFEFALRDRRPQRVAAPVVLDDLNSVQPVLDMVAADDDLRMVELALRREPLAGRGQYVVKRPAGVLVLDAGVLHALVFGAEGKALALLL